MVIRKIAPRKIAPQKFAHENIACAPPPSENCPQWKNLPPCMNSPPYESSPCENYPPPVSSRNLPPRKLAPMKILPWINYTNERKDKFTKFFDLKKAVQHNILIEITKALFDTQMISQKILGLDTFFTEWKKIERKRKSPNGQVKEN